MKLIFILLSFSFLFFSLSLFSKAYAIEDSIKSIRWHKNLEGRYKKESKLPLYTVTFYFADGALSDPRDKSGLTQVMFDLLRSGTTKMNKAQIDENLDFLAVRMGASVSQEYSSLTYSGLAQHVIPTTKLFCQILKNANFPKDELDNYKMRESSDLINLPIHPQALAERVFRSLLFKKTPYSNSTTASLNSLKYIGSQDLFEQLQYFLSKVKKRIYITGPSDSLKIRDILLNECGINLEQSTFVREVKKDLKSVQPMIYLVPLDSLNQAQIRMGRFLNRNELSDPYLMSLVSEFLGGGFTSLLNYELRIKKGLVYGSGSYLSLQREYGRLGVVTSTRIEGVLESIRSIEKVLNDLGKGQFKDEDLKRFVDYLTGSYLFGFENSEAFLGQIAFLDHVGRDYHELFQFPEIVKSYTKNQVISKGKFLFDPSKQIILVLGPKKLEKELKKLGRKVEIVNYKNYL